jgi:NAD(P)-dependent dehydrogenase (short-subunit alcohol dehydrogenase family)
MGRFDGKVVLIGGNVGKAKEEFVLGLSGIVAKQLVAEGAQVILVDINPKDAEACAKIIGGKCKAVACDLMKDRTYEKKTIDTEKGPKEEVFWIDNPALKMINDIATEFGKIDAVILNFDVFDQARIDATTEELYTMLREQNITPTFHILAALREQFAAQTKKDGTYAKVVMITNMVGKSGMSMGSVYSAFKGAIVGLNKGLCREFGRFANVNTVAYGPFADNKKYQGPKDRIKKANFMLTSGEMSNINLTPEHVMPLVVFLASDDAAGISGQSISVDGGLWLKLEQ